MYKERLKAGYEKADIMRSIHAKGRDNGRTPMQWDGSLHAGFTTGTPWIKVNPNYTQINAADQVDDPDSIFSWYRKLIELRKTYPVIVDGDFELLLEEDENIFAYTRSTDAQKLLVICNFYGSTLNMPPEVQCRDMELLLCNYGDEADVLRPYEARMYITRGWLPMLWSAGES